MGLLKVCLTFCLVIAVVVENRRITKLERIENVLKRTNRILDDLKREVVISSDEESCEDKQTKCGDWKEKDGDEWEENCATKPYLQSHCKKSCNFCDSGSGGVTEEPPVTVAPPETEAPPPTETPECADVKPQACAEAKEKETNPVKWERRCNKGKFLLDNCKKTCGHCDGGSGGSGQTSEAPVKTTEAPVKPTEAPVKTTVAPVKTTEAPVKTTEAPVKTTEAPVKTTEIPTEKTEEPAGSGSGIDSLIEECTSDNKEHCECGEAPFETYVFKIDTQTRCFTVYRPEGFEGKPVPVVITSQCYGKDRLMSIGMTNTMTGDNVAAARYGFARIGLSTPDGGWTFGNYGIVNDTVRMPCSEDDSKDIAYVNKVFEYIDSHPDKFDVNRIYTEGFSQNSMFSAYIGFCHSDRVTGIWQGGSGLAFKSDDGINLPGKQAKCSAISYAEDGRNCIECTDCKYWPIYPCYQPKKPMIDCIADYNNDYIASSRSNSETESTTLNMYNVAKDEGHDARMLRFKPSDDGTIAGGHKNPRNTVYWQMGCWGMTEKCSSECETSFKTCVNGKDVSKAENRVNSFEACIEKDTFKDLSGCDSTCSPTFEMLKQSEVPYKAEFAYGKFGGNDESGLAKPSTSQCTAE